MQPSYGNIPCCYLGSYTLGAVRRATLEEPAAVNLHGGSARGKSRGATRTASGTHSIVVTGTSGSATQSTILTLTVQ
jgi:hypothetical protein